MTTYSSTQLATRVLRFLGLVGVSEVPDADTLADTIEIITSDMAAMTKRGIPIWNGSSASLPQEYLIPETMRLSLPVGVSFGLYSAAEAAAGIIPAERVLRELSAKQADGSVAESEYF